MNYNRAKAGGLTLYRPVETAGQLYDDTRFNDRIQPFHRRD